jgi:hypothetical protein
MSKIFHLRNLDNWIKSVLISEANSVMELGWMRWGNQKESQLRLIYPNGFDSQTFPLKKQFSHVLDSDVNIDRILRVRSKLQLEVLDFGCGKGGDIGKWLKCGKGISTTALYRY